MGRSARAHARADGLAVARIGEILLDQPDQGVECGVALWPLGTNTQIVSALHRQPLGSSSFVILGFVAG